MEFRELVKARRSCRAFESSQIPENQIAAILEAGQWAPSPLNLQPWEYIIITDKEVQIQIIKAAEEAKQSVIDSDGPGWVSKYSMEFLAGAPVYLVVAFDPSKGGLGTFFNQPHGALQAVSACVQNMMLAAADLGLGSLWFTFFAPQKVKSILNIPENLEIAGCIPLGKPSEEIKAPPRKEPKVHRERYTT
ncbi:MAG: nitroreductase family protein [Desulfobacterales bacterium]|nr:MAG: nitroreductase family protein [Desulfobacterales bacterium]